MSASVLAGPPWVCASCGTEQPMPPNVCDRCGGRMFVRVVKVSDAPERFVLHELHTKAAP